MVPKRKCVNADDQTEVGSIVKTRTLIRVLVRDRHQTPLEAEDARDISLSDVTNLTCTSGDLNTEWRLKASDEDEKLNSSFCILPAFSRRKQVAWVEDVQYVAEQIGAYFCAICF